VEHIDWSYAVVDGPLNMHGRYILQSNDGSREVLHWDGLTGKKITHNQRDCMWSTWTCTLGFPVLGIWPDFSDGAQLAATGKQRSPVRECEFACNVQVLMSTQCVVLG
jgi:lipoxygenase homology domain-containing protein 1